jgi:hypothetical protein
VRSISNDRRLAYDPATILPRQRLALALLALDQVACGPPVGEHGASSDAPGWTRAVGSPEPKRDVEPGAGLRHLRAVLARASR